MGSIHQDLSGGVKTATTPQIPCVTYPINNGAKQTIWNLRYKLADRENVRRVNATGCFSDKDHSIQDEGWFDLKHHDCGHERGKKDAEDPVLQICVEGLRHLCSSFARRTRTSN